MNSEYRYLRVDLLIDTADRLASRIVGRFPEASLGKVAASISDVAREAVARAEKIQRPIWWLRVGLIVLGLVILAAAAAVVREQRQGGDPPLQRLLAFMRQTQGAAVYLSAAVVFLITLETRWKRARAVRAIHELRALAHIIDMHQLSKDPDCIPRAGNTPYNREGMLQYLHYCTEMLAVLSKVGQLYVEDFHDGTTLAAVDQFENLATGLSQKIWQKIMILNELITDHDQAERPAPGGA